jgi:hypothetical protein
MLSLLLGPTPSGRLLASAALVLAIIALVVHLLRRRLATDTCKPRFKRGAAITSLVLLTVLAAVSWTGQLEIQDSFHIAGLVFSVVTIVVIVLWLGNALRSPGVVGKLVESPLQVLTITLVIAVAMSNYNVIMAKTQPPWSNSLYKFTLWVADYGIPTYLIWTMCVLVIAGCVFGIKKLFK